MNIWGSMHPFPTLRALFCIAAAVMAAAIVDPIVETMSNSGVFGPGIFTDHSNRDVIPALVVGAVLAAVVLGFVAWRLLTNRVYAPLWLRESALHFAPSSMLSVVPVVFAFQLVSLFAMETLEQIVVWGHVLGPTIWLGGPIAASLLMHLAGSFCVTWILAHVLRRSAYTIANVVRFVLQAFVKLCPSRPVVHAKRVGTSPARFIEPIIARLKGRAPPYLSIAR